MRKTITKISGILAAFMCIGLLLSSCTKEGPTGPAGLNGKDGKNAAETCTQCHNATVVGKIATEYEFSKHLYGEAAFEEAGNTTCSPCHTSDAFQYICSNNIPSTYTLNTTTGKYVLDYVVPANKTLGELNCFTCHNKLHTTYASGDLPAIITKAPVSMVMWGGAKTINLPQDDGSSHLCVKCHQPRAMTKSSTLSDGNVVNYDSLKLAPTLVYFDSAIGNAAPNRLTPSYRLHNHYGVVGGVFAGIGAVEFAGAETYLNSQHTTKASCQDCHMAPITGRAGGHTFLAKGNFNGCNVAGCHDANPINATNSAYWTTPRATIKGLLDQLATKINAIGSGKDILHVDATSTNLWIGLTTKNYDGYLDIYDASVNPSGYWRNPSNTSAANMAKPKFPSLTNARLGAIINFNFCLREYSLGIHNYKYVYALLKNTIAILP